MQIIIVGAGKMGFAVANSLINEGHNVTVIDNNESVVDRGENTMDALFIRGNGVRVDVLKEANVENADIVIATTAGDEINMLVCLTAKKLGAQYAIARIRDPEYLESLSFLQKEMFMDYVINPERSTAREVSRMLRFPFVSGVETFARGRVEMVDFRAAEGDGIAGVALKDIYKNRKNLPQVLFCTVERDGEAIIPKGDFVIQPGDRVYVAGDVNTITAFFRAIGKGVSAIRSVMMLGGGRLSFYLAQILQNMHIKVNMIEIQPEKARTLSEMLPNVNIIQGDGTDQELLESEGLTDMDAFITLSNRDEENLMTGLYAVHRGVKRVIVKSSRENYSSIMKNMGLDSIVSTLNVAVNNILRTVRTRSSRSSAAVVRMYRLVNGKAEALEFLADNKMPFIHVPLKELNIDKDCLIAVIVRGNKVLVPFGNDTIESGDSVVIISKRTGISTLDEVIHLR
ncbi:MAG: Trk system potassium transporter TrkA [Clostridia bacterium]|nr:Trk system potassium transporter TrkA [Clostridia bacterium]